jgi:hypothetical protein
MDSGDQDHRERLVPGGLESYEYKLVIGISEDHLKLATFLGSANRNIYS